MRLHTTMQVLGRYQSWFIAQVKLQTGVIAFRVNGLTGLAQMRLSSIREPFLWWVDI